MDYKNKSIPTISIHALRGEDDDAQPEAVDYVTRFQSTPSVGRTTLV